MTKSGQWQFRANIAYWFSCALSSQRRDSHVRYGMLMKKMNWKEMPHVYMGLRIAPFRIYPRIILTNQNNGMRNEFPFYFSVLQMSSTAYFGQCSA